MEKVKDVFEHCKWLIEKGRGEEPGKLFMPKVEAQRRKQNKEQSKRVVFVTEPETYSAWHTQKDRYVEICGGNPSIAYQVMLQILGAISTEAIEAMYRDEQQEDHNEQ